MKDFWCGNGKEGEKERKDMQNGETAFIVLLIIMLLSDGENKLLVLALLYILS